MKSMQITPAALNSLLCCQGAVLPCVFPRFFLDLLLSEMLQKIYRKWLFFFPFCGSIACCVVAKALPLVAPSVEFPQSYRGFFGKSSKIVIWMLQKHLQPQLHFQVLIWGQSPFSRNREKSKIFAACCSTLG